MRVNYEEAQKFIFFIPTIAQLIEFVIGDTKATGLEYWTRALSLTKDEYEIKLVRLNSLKVEEIRRNNYPAPAEETKFFEDLLSTVEYIDHKEKVPYPVVYKTNEDLIKLNREIGDKIWGGDPLIDENGNVLHNLSNVNQHILSVLLNLSTATVIKYGSALDVSRVKYDIIYTDGGIGKELTVSIEHLHKDEDKPTVHNISIQYTRMGGGEYMAHLEDMRNGK